MNRYRPDCVLVFDAFGSSAHFRRVEGNSTAQTYRIPPKTTVAGMIAAMVGYPHDSYYDRFQRDNSAIGVIPLSALRTQIESVIQPNTDDESRHIVSGGPEGAIKLPRTWGDERKQQRNPYAYLFDVGYRFVVGLKDTETYDALREALVTRQYEFAPYLGKSECGCRIDYRGERSVEWIETDMLDSALPASALGNGDDKRGGMYAIVQEPETTIDTERSPAAMTLVAEGGSVPDPRESDRMASEFETWTLRRDGGPLSLVSSIEAARIGASIGSDDGEYSRVDVALDDVSDPEGQVIAFA